MDKHPGMSAPRSEAILEASNVFELHPVMFDAIDGNVQKSWLLVKEEFLSDAERVFFWIGCQHHNGRKRLPRCTLGYNLF